jgi:hypothetical protein
VKTKIFAAYFSGQMFHFWTMKIIETTGSYRVQSPTMNRPVCEFEFWESRRPGFGEKLFW